MAKVSKLQDKAATPEVTEAEVRLIGLSVVMSMTSLKKTTIYKLMRLREFPKSIWLTGDGSRVAWLFHEVQGWIFQRVALRDFHAGGVEDE